MARAQKAGKAKRRRMLRCNLGSKKFTKELQRIRTEIQNTVNKALNDILKQSPAQVYALEDLSHRFTFEGKYSRKVRNLLSKWVRGMIKDRFLFKASKAYRWCLRLLPIRHSIARSAATRLEIIDRVIGLNANIAAIKRRPIKTERRICFSGSTIRSTGAT